MPMHRFVIHVDEKRSIRHSLDQQRVALSHAPVLDDVNQAMRTPH